MSCRFSEEQMKMMFYRGALFQLLDSYNSDSITSSKHHSHYVNSIPLFCKEFGELAQEAYPDIVKRHYDKNYLMTLYEIEEFLKDAELPYELCIEEKGEMSDLLSVTLKEISTTNMYELFANELQTMFHDESSVDNSSNPEESTQEESEYYLSLIYKLIESKELKIANDVTTFVKNIHNGLLLQLIQSSLLYLTHETIYEILPKKIFLFNPDKFIKDLKNTNKLLTYKDIDTVNLHGLGNLELYAIHFNLDLYENSCSKTKLVASPASESDSTEEEK